MDYERIRREKLEAQVDEYRREMAYLQSRIEENPDFSPVSRNTQISKANEGLECSNKTSPSFEKSSFYDRLENQLGFQGEIVLDLE